MQGQQNISFPYEIEQKKKERKRKAVNNKH